MLARRGSMSPSLFKRVKPGRAGRPAWKCAEDFKRWLRHLACPRCGQLPGMLSNPIVAAHVDHAGGKGASTKVADRHCIPLCNDCHREQTDVLGWGRFEAQLPGGDAIALAADYWQNWPDRREWEAELAAQEAAGVPMRGRP